LGKVTDIAWVTKAEAMKMLGVSSRQLERRVRQGYIEKRIEPRRPTETSARSVHSKADIVALKAGNPNIHARLVVAEKPGEPAKAQPSDADSTALAVRDARDPFAGLAAQLAGLATFAAQYPAPAAPRPWLTLAEAVEYSGLTRPWLLDRAKAGGIAIRDMGKHSRGGRWRFNREELARAGK
jgi:hypothetical protein